MLRPKWTVFASAALGLMIGPGAAKADVKIASIFTDHMVVQRDMKIPVWGTAEAGEEVTVSLDKQKLNTKAGATANGWSGWTRSNPAAAPWN